MTELGSAIIESDHSRLFISCHGQSLRGSKTSGSSSIMRRAMKYVLRNSMTGDYQWKKSLDCILNKFFYNEVYSKSLILFCDNIK